MQDVQLLVEKFESENLLEAGGNRTHSPSLLNTTRNPMAGINGQSLKDWISKRIEMCRIRQYYRQFSAVQHDTFDSEHL